MAFKSFSQYQEDKNGDFFVLPNDGDTADVVFLYRSPEEVLVGDVHYISSASYKGYAHCCGAGCPACNYVTQNGNRGIRLDHKIFIPLYNLSAGKIQFWDRSTFFESTLQKYVFKGFPNPSETVFRITRRGEAGSRDTTYQIDAIGRNTFMSYDEILAKGGMTLPDGSPFTLPEGYSVICKEMTAAEMSSALNSGSAAAGAPLEDYNYVPVPRGSLTAEDFSTPSPNVNLPEYSAPPTVAPPTENNPATNLPEYVPGAEPVGNSLPEYDPNNVPQEGVSNQVGDDSADSLSDVQF